jgi:hypothetical protein
MFDAKGDEMSGEWKKFGNEENHDMIYSPPGVMLLVKSDQSLSKHVTRLENDKCIQSFGRKPSRKENVWEINASSRRILLHLILGKQSMKLLTGFIWLNRVEWDSSVTVL